MLPNPTAEDLEDPMFKAIWDVMNTWDVEVPGDGGREGVSGSHVMVILNAVRATQNQKILDLTLLVRQIIANRACGCNRPEHRCGTNQMLDDLEAILGVCMLSAPFGQHGGAVVCRQPLPCRFHPK